MGRYACRLFTDVRNYVTSHDNGCHAEINFFFTWPGNQSTNNLNVAPPSVHCSDRSSRERTSTHVSAMIAVGGWIESLPCCAG